MAGLNLSPFERGMITMKAAKALVAVIGAGITAALGLGLHGTAQQVLTVAAAMITALGVFLVPNATGVPEGGATK